jgi:hypothetical protein
MIEENILYNAVEHFIGGHVLKAEPFHIRSLNFLARKS